MFSRERPASHPSHPSSTKPRNPSLFQRYWSDREREKPPADCRLGLFFPPSLRSARRPLDFVNGPAGEHRTSNAQLPTFNGEPRKAVGFDVRRSALDVRRSAGSVSASHRLSYEFDESSKSLSFSAAVVRQEEGEAACQQFSFWTRNASGARVFNSQRLVSATRLEGSDARRRFDLLRTAARRPRSAAVPSRSRFARRRDAVPFLRARHGDLLRLRTAVLRPHRSSVQNENCWPPADYDPELGDARVGAPSSRTALTFPEPTTPS